VANSLLASTRILARMIGPAAAGLLTVSVGGGWAIAADAASFLLAAVCFGRISLPTRPPRAAGSPTMLSELRDGWTYFSSRPWIWSVTLAFAVLNAAYMGIWQILGPVIAVDTIGAEGWGLVLSARAAGSLLATVVMVKLTVRRPMVRALSLMTLSAVPLILLGVGANALWLAAAGFVAGMAAEFFTVVWSTVCSPIHSSPDSVDSSISPRARVAIASGCTSISPNGYFPGSVPTTSSGPSPRFPSVSCRFRSWPQLLAPQLWPSPAGHCWRWPCCYPYSYRRCGESR
jgi:hypothetical protein